MAGASPLEGGGEAAGEPGERARMDAAMHSSPMQSPCAYQMAPRLIHAYTQVSEILEWEKLLVLSTKAGPIMETLPSACHAMNKQCGITDMPLRNVQEAGEARSAEQELREALCKTHSISSNKVRPVSLVGRPLLLPL